ncbi:MAG: hypothetical protein FWD34_02895 [Oscillospiraceae bacterium]|nr:hypothetical protein [Oscillospiraceae bacterium]
MKIKKTLKQLDTIPLPENPYARSQKSRNYALQLVPLCAALVLIIGGAFMFAVLNNNELPIFSEAPPPVDDIPEQTEPFNIWMSHSDRTTNFWTSEDYQFSINSTVHEIEIPDVLPDNLTEWRKEHFFDYHGEDFIMNDITRVNDYTVFAGTKYFYKEHELGGYTFGYTLGYVALIDSNEQVVWERYSPGESEQEGYFKIQCDETGIYIFGLTCDFLYSGVTSGSGRVTVTKYDYDGNIIDRQAMSTMFGTGAWIESGIIYDGNWFALIGTGHGGNAVVTSKGSYYYFDNGRKYNFSQMVIYNDELYLSGYYTPVPTLGTIFEPIQMSDDPDNPATPPEPWSERSDIWNNTQTHGEDSLTEFWQEYYTAVLLVCDPLTMNPKSITTVNGSMGIDLLINGDEIFWKTAAIVNVVFSPMTSAFSFMAMCEVSEWVHIMDWYFEREDTEYSYVFVR